MRASSRASTVNSLASNVSRTRRLASIRTGASLGDILLICRQISSSGPRPPAGPGIRVDTAAYTDGVIPPYYDSLVAKVIAHGRDRTESIARMKRSVSSRLALLRPALTMTCEGMSRQ